MSDETSFGGARNLVDLIDQLVEPAPPPPISMMPQTAGWWILGLSVFVGLCALGYRWYREYQRNAYRRAALSEVDATEQDVAALASILRRTALSAYPRREIASLSGEAWLNFLDETVDSTTFSTGPGQILATAPYQPAQPADPALVAAVKSWIADHKGQGMP